MLLGLGEPKEQQKIRGGEILDSFDFAPENGLCSGHDIDMWFPPTKRGAESREERIARARNEDTAKEICSNCEVMLPCLEYSLRHEPFGTWGGMNEIERAQLRVKRNISLSRDGRIIVPGIGSMNAVTGAIAYKKSARTL